MIFEFDNQKNKSNRDKHGISLDDATVLWSVPTVIVEARTVDEPRYMIIGRVKRKLYSCIYTVRGDTIRPISARRSRKSEEKIYYEYV